MTDAFRDSVDGFDGYPDSWKPRVGESLIGQVVRYERTDGEYGPCVVCTVMNEDTGAEVSVWVSTEAMKGAFAHASPKPGERIGLKRLEDGVNRAGRSYKKFHLRVDRTPEAEDMPDFGAQPSFVDAAREMDAAEGVTQEQVLAGGGPGAPGSESPPLTDDLPF